MSRAIEKLCIRPDVLVLAPDQVDAFVAAGTRVLFFTGNATRHPEIDDVATILPELIRAIGHAVMVGVIDPDLDRASAIRFRITVRPTLVFLHDGTVLGAVPRMKDWAVYLRDIEMMFAPLTQRAS